jgi:hypothetical protein
MPFLSWASMVAVAPQLIRLKAYRSVYSMAPNISAIRTCASF